MSDERDWMIPECRIRRQTPFFFSNYQYSQSYSTAFSGVHLCLSLLLFIQFVTLSLHKPFQCVYTSKYEVTTGDEWGAMLHVASVPGDFGGRRSPKMAR